MAGDQDVLRIQRMAEFADFGSDVAAFERWMDKLPPAAQKKFLDDFYEQAPPVPDIPPPEGVWEWLDATHPHFTAFGEHHVTFWNWVGGIRLGVRSRPFVFIINRGGGKTSGAEAAIAYLAGHKKRRYGWYVQEVQGQSDNTLANVGASFRSKRMAPYHPELASAKAVYYEDKGVTKLQRGQWNRQRLTVSNGFVMDAMGLDSARRGARVEDQRPDFIIFDDIDGKHDSLSATRKKIGTITTSILPAGSTDCIILVLQNLIIPNGVVSQLSDNRADFLLDRIVVGPIPAVRKLVWERQAQADGGRRYKIVSGEATWGGMPLAVCENMMNDWGISAFLKEAQHEVDAEPGGMFSDLEYEHCRMDEVPELIDAQIWVDPAVTSTDNSDSMAIQADGLGVDGKLYRLYSFEEVTTPEDVLKTAILKALELKISVIGVETNQGGDTWGIVYDKVCRDLLEDEAYPFILSQEMIDDGDYPEGTKATVFPTYTEAKATVSTGSKTARASQMKVDYELGDIIHVIGTHNVLEKALYRFPKTKPYDLVDAAYWGWSHLMGETTIF